MLLADMADGGSARCYPAAARAASGRGERWKDEVDLRETVSQENRDKN